MSARFGWVTSGHAHGPSSFDIDLCGSPLAAVVPTLGSLVPGWVLVVPRVEALALRNLSPTARKAILAFAESVGAELTEFSRAPYILEHGPARAHTVIGCGVDQSHLHVVPTDSDLLAPVLEDKTVAWTRVRSPDPWEACEDGREYLLIRRGDECYVGAPHVPQSQYFRRKLAQLEGMPHAWDYREWPCYDNAKRTIAHFAGARSRKRAA